VFHWLCIILYERGHAWWLNVVQGLCTVKRLGFHNQSLDSNKNSAWKNTQHQIELKQSPQLLLNQTINKQVGKLPQLLRGHIKPPDSVVLRCWMVSEAKEEQAGYSHLLALAFLLVCFFVVEASVSVAIQCHSITRYTFQQMPPCCMPSASSPQQPQQHFFRMHSTKSAKKWESIELSSVDTQLCQTCLHVHIQEAG